MGPRIAVTAIVALLLAPASARAATYTVCAGGCDFASIGTALLTVSAGDVVRVSPGTYNTGPFLVPAGVRLEAATIGTATLSTSLGGTTLVTFAGAGASIAGFVLEPASNGRAFSTGAPATIEDVSMSSRSFSSDGAILSSTAGAAPVVIRRSTFTGISTSASSGGLIRATGGTLVLDHVTFSDTRAVNVISGEGTAAVELHSVDVGCTSGRGLRFSSSAADGLVIDGGSFTNCSPSAAPLMGGGAYVVLGGTASFSVEGTRFEGGSATEGGGLYFDGLTGRVSRMTNVTFVGNATTGATASGGALRVIDGTVELVDATFTGNTTSGVGSAIAVSGAGPGVTVVRGSFCGNTETSTGSGSVIRIDQGTLAVRASLFGGNGGFVIEGQTGVSSISVDHSVLLYDEGAIFRRTTLSLTNSVIAYTTPYQTISGLVSTGTTTIENNLFFANATEPTGLSSTNVVGVDPGYFASDAATPCSSDLRVRTTSPLLDAGTGAMDLDGTPADIGLHGGPDAAASWWVDTDSDGSPRVYDCAPADDTIRPGHVELCNGIDDNCDLAIDDGLALGTSCTSGAGLCASTGTRVCGGGGAVVCDATPGIGSTELCGSGADEDCDGNTDEGFPLLGSSCSAGIGACVASGVHVCAPDRLSTRCDAVPGSPGTETCGGGDEDCDGTADDGPVCAGMSEGTSCVGAGTAGARCGCATDLDCASGRRCDASGTCVVVGSPDAGSIDGGSMFDAGAVSDASSEADAAMLDDAGTPPVDAAPPDAARFDDGGMDAATSDASWVDTRGDASAPDAGPGTTAGGCSCGVAARPPSRAGALVGLLLAGWIARRRRAR